MKLNYTVTFSIPGGQGEESLRLLKERATSALSLLPASVSQATHGLVEVSMAPGDVEEPDRFSEVCECGEIATHTKFVMTAFGKSHKEPQCASCHHLVI
jgi:hypothetical protein